MGSQAETLLIALISLVLVSSSVATNLYVGGKDGWVLHPTESYSHWAGRLRFSINDTLIFKYKRGEDSVLQVEKEDYLSCNISKPLQRMGSGNSFFQFERSGAFYFISGKQEKCSQGQKVIVVVLSPRDRATSPRPSVQPPSQLPLAPAPNGFPQEDTPPASAPAPNAFPHEDTPPAPNALPKEDTPSASSPVSGQTHAHSSSLVLFPSKLVLLAVLILAIVIS